MNQEKHRVSLPRVLLAAPSSGGGKTTVTCALLWILRDMGLSPVSFKCGPDYLDPMFHRAVIGVDSANLDPFFLDREGLSSVIASNAEGHGIAVAEGVMGYYDGGGEDGTEDSTYTVADRTETPVILVVNGKGAFTSTLAVIEGFLRFVPNSRIRGVLFNQTREATYGKLKKMTEDRFGDRVVPVGFLPPLPPECVLESRHLGLVTADEVDHLKDKLEKAAAILKPSLDIDAVLKIAREAGELSAEIPAVEDAEKVRIAVARDRAFCFCYGETLKLFERMGGEIAAFSPLENEPVPEGASGLYLPGGYPELYADALERAEVTKASVRCAVEGGMPTIAECGGFMFLSSKLDGYEMCGVLPGCSEKKSRLVRFGYVEVRTDREGLFGAAGTRLRGHEFHYYDCTENGADLTAVKRGGSDYPFGFYSDSLYAGYPHLCLSSNPAAARAFLRKCLAYQEKRT